MSESLHLSMKHCCPWMLTSMFTYMRENDNFLYTRIVSGKLTTKLREIFELTHFVLEDFIGLMGCLH